MNNDLVKILCFQDLDAVCIISPGWVRQCCTCSLTERKNKGQNGLTNVLICDSAEGWDVIHCSNIRLGTLLTYLPLPSAQECSSYLGLLVADLESRPAFLSPLVRKEVKTTKKKTKKQPIAIYSKLNSIYSQQYYKKTCSKITFLV